LPVRTARSLCKVTSAAALLACAGFARADMYYWTGGGSTNRFTQLDSASLSIFRFDPISAYLGSVQGGQSTTASKNLFSPNSPGGVDGHFATADVIDELSDPQNPVHHLVFASPFHADRTATIDTSVSCQSLQFTTDGDARITTTGVNGEAIWVDGTLLRWPGCTGNLEFDIHVGAKYLWLGGTGEVSFRRSIDHSGGTLTEPLIKSGAATMIIDPVDVSSTALDGAYVVRSGDFILKGPGGPLLRYTARISVGTEFGGAAAMPTDLPYPGWEPIELSPPPLPSPAVHVRQTGVADDRAQILLGQQGSLVFDAPMSISFDASVTATALGAGTIVVHTAPTNQVALHAGTLSNFVGVLRIDSGVVRTPPISAFASIVFNSSTSADDAVLELTVPSNLTVFRNPYTGLGRLTKAGEGTLELSDEAPSFTGDYRVAAGTLRTSQVPGRSVLRNSVAVAGGLLINLASENIDDGTQVTLDGGAWSLAGFTETIAGLLLHDNSICSLGGGTLRMAGNVVAFPSGASTATISPGALFFVGSDARTINVGASGAPVGLDIKSSVSGAPVLVTGTGVAQFSGAFNSPSLEVRTGSASLHIPAASAKPASITVGYADPFNPDAPTARLVLAASDQIPDSLTLNLVNRADFALSGFTDRIGGLNISGAGPFSITTSDGVNPGGLDLAGNATFSGGATTINGGLGLAAQSRTFQINSGASVTLSGQLYSGRLSKVGSGTLRLDALESFIPIDLTGASSSVGTATVAGFTGTTGLRIDTSLIVNPAAAVSTGFGGSFTGPGSFTKSGAGQFEFNGGAFNSYAGGTRVEGGTLFLNRFPGTTVIPGNATIASGGKILFAGGASNEIADSADITVESGGTVDMNGQTEIIRSATISGTWTIDSPTGAPGNLAATQSLFVAGGTLTGNVSGGALTVSTGTAHLRGTIPSASLSLASSLWVGGFAGSDQLTISGPLSLATNTTTLKFTTGVATDPPLIRALGSLSFPIFGTVPVRVDQLTPQPVGTAIKLLDCGSGTGNPQLSRFALGAPGAGSGRGVLTVNNRVLSYVVTGNPCAADTNGSGDLSVQDIFDFLTIWFAGSTGADFNQSGQTTVQDIFDFLTNWFNGC
jgi:autotransporter-associated beta strand protein